MLSLFTRWRLARTPEPTMPSAPSEDSSRYVEQLRRIESRLVREAPLDMESPPVMLRRRTMDALHEITMYRRRRPVLWWQRPQVTASFAAVFALLIGAVAGLLTMGSDPYARYDRAALSSGESSSGLDRPDGSSVSSDRLFADGTWRTRDDEAPAVLQIIYELDAMASDARRAADYLVSQFTAASRERSRGSSVEPDGSQHGGQVEPPPAGPTPNGGQAPRPQ